MFIEVSDKRKLIYKLSKAIQIVAIREKIQT